MERTQNNIAIVGYIVQLYLYYCYFVPNCATCWSSCDDSTCTGSVVWGVLIHFSASHQINKYSPEVWEKGDSMPLLCWAPAICVRYIVRKAKHTTLAATYPGDTYTHKVAGETVQLPSHPRDGTRSIRTAAAAESS